MIVEANPPPTERAGAEQVSFEHRGVDQAGTAPPKVTGYTAPPPPGGVPRDSKIGGETACAKMPFCLNRVFGA